MLLVMIILWHKKKSRKEFKHPYRELFQKFVFCYGFVVEIINPAGQS